jgi:IgA Peptidase M64
LSYRSGLTTLVLLAGLCCAAAGRAQDQIQSQDRFPAHYIVFSIDEDGDVTPVFHRKVLLAAPLVSRTDGELERLRSTPAAGDGSLDVEVLDAAGDVVFRDRMTLPTWVRGEFHGGREGSGWSIDGHLFPQQDRAFVVRVPPVADGTLRLALGDTFRRREESAAFSLADLAAREDLLAVPEAPPADVVWAPSTISGSPANRVDLVILGDGYTVAQASQLQTDAANLETSFFAAAPYSTYKNYFNRIILATTSAQSGADHPPYNPSCLSENRACCAAIEAASDPLAGTYVNTALGARFCAFNIHRLLVVDSAPVFAAASAYPDWDEILVLVNDTTYGGAGGSFAVVSRNTFAVDVARHEFGHSFTRLADEYDSAYPGYPACSDLSGGSPCEANVTNQTTRASIKWAPWIAGATPVPTPEGIGLYANAAGLFQGARYLTSGMYRHRDASCLMNVLGVGFGEVCSQEFVFRLYLGGWGVPGAGIDPIEPGLEAPSPGTYTALTGATFSTSLLGPIGGPPVQATWKVNGSPVPGATGSSYVFIAGGAGSYQVTLEARDVTTLAHPSMAGTIVDSSRSWTVNVSPSPETSFYTLTPCRLFDTRSAAGPLGGPILAAGASRSFNLAGVCGIPGTARAVVGNLTVITPAQAGFLALFAGASPQPPTSALTFASGQTLSNINTLALQQNGLGTVILKSGTGGAAHVALDVTGYYQ